MGRKAKLSDPSYGHGNPRNVDWAIKYYANWDRLKMLSLRQEGLKVM